MRRSGTTTKRRRLGDRPGHLRPRTKEDRAAAESRGARQSIALRATSPRAQSQRRRRSGPRGFWWRSLGPPLNSAAVIKKATTRICATRESQASQFWIVQRAETGERRNQLEGHRPEILLRNYSRCERNGSTALATSSGNSSWTDSLPRGSSEALIPGSAASASISARERAGVSAP